MSIIESLKNSPKGQLSYNRKLEPFELKHVLDQVSPVPLSRLHEERDSSKFNLSFGLDASSFEDNSASYDDYNENYSQDEKDSELLLASVVDSRDSYGLPKSDHKQEKQDSSKDDLMPPRLAVPSGSFGKSFSRHDDSWENLEFGISPGIIEEEERKWKEIYDFSLMKRSMEFEAHERALSLLMGQKEQEMVLKLDRLSHNRQNVIDRKLQEGAAETEKLLQRLKEDREEHHMKIESKHKEIEKHRVRLQEEERVRQAIRQEKLSHLRAAYQEVDKNRTMFIQLHDNYSHREALSDNVAKFRTILDNICSKLALQVEAANKHDVSLDELIKTFNDHKTKSHQSVELLKKQIAEVDGKVKQIEDQNKEAEQKKAEEAKKKEEEKKLTAQAMADCGVQALAYILAEFEAKKQKLAQVEAGLQEFVNDAQMKKVRFDLQRSVNTPINAISAISGSHLRDKLQRLHRLLSGQPVEVGGKQVVATASPHGIMFCQNLIAKMLVRKGEEQVTSKHDSAFAISAVAVGLWAEFPVLGDLFLAHLQAACPYVLPFYAPRQEGQSSADYHRSLGYKVSEDGSVEDQDKFLRRMSGLMRLYCACLVSMPPKGENSPHPQGLEYAWSWLCRTLNLDPHPDVTAAMLHDVLSVTGHALLNEYRVQFVKLVQTVHQSYIPKLKSVSVTSATVGRLEIFLETTLKNSGRIPPPEGLLPPNFWFR